MEKQGSQQSEANKNEKLLVRLSLLVQAIALLGIAIAVIFILLVQYPHLFPSGEKVEITSQALPPADEDKVENGLDVQSGFVAEGDYLVVKRTCTACHGGKLVTQNRASREGWLDMIRWMQQTQKLWDLGPQEDKILDYLATYYGPEKKGRRVPLAVEEWYVIE